MSKFGSSRLFALLLAACGASVLLSACAVEPEEHEWHAYGYATPDYDYPRVYTTPPAVVITPSWREEHERREHRHYRFHRDDD